MDLILIGINSAARQSANQQRDCLLFPRQSKNNKNQLNTEWLITSVENLEGYKWVKDMSGKKINS